MLRRFMLVGVFVIVKQGSVDQIAFASLLSSIFLATQTTCAPFRTASDDYMARGCSLCLSLLFIICVIYKYAQLTQLHAAAKVNERGRVPVRVRTRNPGPCHRVLHDQTRPPQIGSPRNHAPLPCPSAPAAMPSRCLRRRRAGRAHARTCGRAMQQSCRSAGPRNRLPRGFPARCGDTSLLTLVLCDLTPSTTELNLGTSAP